jgi:uncharacterized protein YqgV (UPF0045/DUF77 family)
MEKMINCGFQLVPIDKTKESAFAKIDEVILLIKKRASSCVVTPFETVAECSLEVAHQLIRDINTLLCESGEMEYLLYVRFHVNSAADVFMDDKTAKHNQV